MWSRRIQLACGVLCGALGLAALGVWEFVPGCAAPLLRCARGSDWQLLGIASLLSPITVVGGLSLGIILFALWSGLARTPGALVLLWVCTGLLGVACITTVMTLPSFDVLIVLQGGGRVVFVLLILAPVLALVASLAGSVVSRQRVPTPG